MNEQPLDLKSSVNEVGRRRRLVATLAGIGFVGGLAYSAVLPPMPSAVALVLLAPTSLTASGTPTRDVSTEIAIATSAPVLSAAGKSVSPPITSSKLKGQVVVTAPTQDILEIKVRDSRPSDAERLANAVAHEYVQYIATSGTTSSANLLAGIRRESSQLTQQIQNLQSQINTVSARVTAEGASSPSGQQDSTLLGSLSNAQRQTSLDLVNVNNQIVTTQLSGAAAEQGTRILQRATGVVALSKLSLLTTGGIGLVLGLVGGIIVALWSARRDRHLRLHDEIAVAIGVPVLGSVEADRLETTEEWAAILESYHPSSVEAWNLRRVLLCLAPGDVAGGSTIRVVSFAEDRPAHAIGLQLAVFAEELGLTTTLLPSDHEAFALLRAARAVSTMTNGTEQAPTSTDHRHGVNRFGDQLTIAMVAVDAARPELDSSPDVTLVAVSAGFATADMLARLALAAVDAGNSIDGILVVNADPSDKTTGSAPDEAVTGRTHGHSRATADQFVQYGPNPAVRVATDTLMSTANGSASNGHAAGPALDETDGPRSPFISLRVLTAACRRHWRLLLAVALVGSLLGAGLHLVVPRKYASTTDLLLTEPANLDPTQAMANDTSLLQTRAVAQRAITGLHLHVTPASFLTSYQGVALSNSILEITFSAHSRAAAVSGGNAVARAFLGVRTDELNHQTQVVVNDLQAQVNSYDSEISRLSSSIDVLSASPAGSQSGDELTNLVDQRSEVTSQVAQVESQIQQEHFNATSVTQASKVLDPAAAIKVSAKKVTITDALSGMIGALGLAVVVLVIAVLLSDRLRSREEVASALGARVELSVLRYAPRRWTRKRRRHQLLDHPSAALRMMERRLRAHLESPGDATLAIVEIEASEAAALTVAMLAFSLASEGRRVVMADMARDRPLASLLGISGREKKLHTVTRGSQSAFLIVGPDDPAEMGRDWIPNGADAMLVLASVDLAFGAEHLVAWSNRAVVVVNPTRASGVSIKATGELLRQARMSIRSTILIGLDPKEDDSLGGLHPDHVDDKEEGAALALLAVRR